MANIKYFYKLLTHAILKILPTYTAQKMKFSIKDFFSKYDQIRKLRIWSHLLKKSLQNKVRPKRSGGIISCYKKLIYSLSSN